MKGFPWSRKDHQDWLDATEGRALRCENKNSGSGRCDCSARRQAAFRYIHVWLVKREAPTFVEFEGRLSRDNPVWRIELTALEPDSKGAKTE
jgi:hypothetical protein